MKVYSGSFVNNNNAIIQGLAGSDIPFGQIDFTPFANDHICFLSSAVISSSTILTDSNTRFKYNNGGGLTNINDFSNSWSTSTTQYSPYFAFKKLTFSRVATQLQYTGISDGSRSLTHLEGCLWAWDMDNQQQYAEDDSETTTTSATFQDKTTLTFTPGTQEDYLVMWCAEIVSGSTTSDVKVQMNLDSGTITAAGNLEARTATTSFDSVGGIDIVNLTAASHTFKIQFCAESAGTTVRIKNARIVAIPVSLLANAQSSEGADFTSTGTGAYEDTAASVTFTAKAKYHLIIASGEFNTDTSGVSGSTRLNVAGAAAQRIDWSLKDTSNFHPFLISTVAKLSAGSNTIKLQAADDGTFSTVQVRKPKVLVIPLDGIHEQHQVSVMDQVDASADDAQHRIDTTTTTLTNASNSLGKNASSQVFSISQRHTPMPIPNSAVIKAANVIIFNQAAKTGTPTLNIKGIKEVNTATFSTYADWNGRTRTTAVVTFNAMTGAITTDEISPDIASIIQEIVNQGSFASGNAIGINIEDNGSGASNFATIRAQDGTAARAPKLWISYLATDVDDPFISKWEVEDVDIIPNRTATIGY